MAIFPVKKTLSSSLTPNNQNISPLSSLSSLSIEEKIKSLLETPINISLDNKNSNKNDKNSKKKFFKKEISSSIKLSIRISSVVTSISLKKSTIAIYMSLFLEEKKVIYLLEKLSQIEKDIALNGKTKKELQKIKKLQVKINSFIYSFIHSHLDEWKEQDGKGLSEFITEKMILKILEYLPEKENEKFILFSSLLKMF